MTEPQEEIVIDTSVVVKWFLHSEPEAEQARSLRQRHVREELTLCAPTLLLWELANVLRHKPGLGLSDTIFAAQSALDLQIQFFEPSPPLLRRAIDVAYSSGITVYDAAFVALATELGCPFVTADHRLVTRVGSPAVLLLNL